MDENIVFSLPKARKDCPMELRLVTIWDDDKKRELSFISNNFNLYPTTISDIYKDRCSIEAFFKAIKQNLKIKTFLGTSENAVKIQLYTALTAMLLMKYLSVLVQDKLGSVELNSYVQTVSSRAHGSLEQA